MKPCMLHVFMVLYTQFIILGAAIYAQATFHPMISYGAHARCAQVVWAHCVTITQTLSQTRSSHAVRGPSVENTLEISTASSTSRGRCKYGSMTRPETGQAVSSLDICVDRIAVTLANCHSSLKTP